jgi:hypothetical protein
MAESAATLGGVGEVPRCAYESQHKQAWTLEVQGVSSKQLKANLGSSNVSGENWFPCREDSTIPEKELFLK